MQMNILVNKAKTILCTDGYTLVLCKEDETVTSSERGIKPLMDLYLESRDYSGFSAADKVIGKAAAFMYVILGIKHIYTAVVSERALEVLEKYNINTEYGKCVPAIENRTKTGFCPMETAVWDMDSPEEALTAIRNKMKEMEKPS